MSTIIININYIVADFILGGSKITADGDHSHEIKRCLLLGRKVMTNLDSILKTLPSALGGGVGGRVPGNAGAGRAPPPAVGRGHNPAPNT